MNVRHMVVYTRAIEFNDCRCLGSEFLIGEYVTSLFCTIYWKSESKSVDVYIRRFNCQLDDIEAEDMIHFIMITVTPLM